MQEMRLFRTNSILELYENSLKFQNKKLNDIRGEAFDLYASKVQIRREWKRDWATQRVPYLEIEHISKFH